MITVELYVNLGAFCCHFLFDKVDHTPPFMILNTFAITSMYAHVTVMQQWYSSAVVVSLYLDIVILKNSLAHLQCCLFVRCIMYTVFPMI